MIDYAALARDITAWIKKHIDAAGASGGVVGVSGGVDSAVTLLLTRLAFPKNTLGIIMPCGNPGEDEALAIRLCEKFDVPYHIAPLENMFGEFRKAAGNNGRDHDLSDDHAKPELLALANTKARLRMAMLYYYAQINGYLVIGTGNRSEEMIGYFTKYGDGGADILPITDLFKYEVKKLGAFLGVIPEILEKVPSGGLWRGQTDEKEIGLSYDEIECAIRKSEGLSIPDRLKGVDGEKAAPRLKKLFDASEHKRVMPPAFRTGRFR